jgi:hypothetical protein
LKGHLGKICCVAVVQLHPWAGKHAPNAPAFAREGAAAAAAAAKAGERAPKCNLGEGRGKLAVSGSEDKTLRLWQLKGKASGKCLRVLRSRGQIACCAVVNGEADGGRGGASGGDRGEWRAGPDLFKNAGKKGKTAPPAAAGGADADGAAAAAAAAATMAAKAKAKAESRRAEDRDDDGDDDAEDDDGHEHRIILIGGAISKTRQHRHTVKSPGAGAEAAAGGAGGAGGSSPAKSSVGFLELGDLDSGHRLHLLEVCALGHC